MPTKPHTGWPGSICTAKANAGRFGYASGGLGTEAHRRSCFTPPEAACAPRRIAGPPHRADEYLRRAQQCLEMARKFRERKARATLFHMAEVWLRLAQRLQQQQQTQPKNDKE